MPLVDVKGVHVNFPFDRSLFVQRCSKDERRCSHCRGIVGIICIDDLSGFASWLSPPSVYLLTESRGPKRPAQRPSNEWACPMASLAVSVYR